MPTEQEYINYKDFVESLDEATPSANDKAVFNDANGPKGSLYSAIANFMLNLWAAFVNAFTAKTSFASGDKIPVVNGSTGTAMNASKLLELTAHNALAGNAAVKFVPNETNAIAGKLYEYNGALFLCLVNYTGVWDNTKFTAFPISDYIFNLSTAIAPIFDPTRTAGNPYKKGEVVIYKGWAFRFVVDEFYGPWTGSGVAYVSMNELKTTNAKFVVSSANKQDLASLLLATVVNDVEKRLGLDLLTTNQVRTSFDIEHKVYNSNGVGTDNTDYDAVYKTPVNPGDIVIITSQIYTGFYSIMAYNKDGEIIDRQFTDGTVTNQLYTVPSNAVALTCQGRNSNYAPGVVFKLTIVADTSWFASSILRNAEAIKELQVKHDEDIDSLYHSIVEELTGLTIESDTRGLIFEPGKYGDNLGRLQPSSTYNSWIYDVKNDTELYCDVPTSPYFSVVVTNTAMSSGVRYRRMPGEDTLPTSENPITVTAGKRLIITERADSHVDWNVVLPQEKYIKSFDPDIPLADEQVQQVIDAMEKKDANKISVKYTSGSGGDNSTERIDIYIPCKVGYCNYKFLHSVYADINCDAWRIGYAIAVSDSFADRYSLTSKGEWECAVHLDGRDDFSGGISHGDEVLDGDPIVFVDGESVSLSDLSSLTECEEFRVVTKSTLYDPADHTTAIAEHGCEHTFTKDGVRIRQSLRWLVNETITSCYMAMNLPTQEVSTKYYTDKDVAPVSTPSPLNLTIDDAKSLVMFDETLGVLNEFYLGRNYPMLEGVNGYLLLTDNNSTTYNKGYFVINRTARSITSGTIWKTEHSVNFKIGL